MRFSILTATAIAVVLASMSLAQAQMGAAGSKGIVVQGGLIVQGGKEAAAPAVSEEAEKFDAGRAGAGLGTKAIGPKPDDPRAAGGGLGGGMGTKAIGPKQDDPRSAVGAGLGTKSIGPKQDDPHSMKDGILVQGKSAKKAAGAGKAGAGLGGGLGAKAIGPKPDDPRAAGGLNQ